jgi:signal transduction histidine kinase
VLVVLDSKPAPLPLQFAMARFIGRIVAETRRPIDELNRDLPCTSPAVARSSLRPAPQEAAPAARRCLFNAQTLQRKLRKIEDMASLLDGATEERSERMLLRTLVDRALGEHASFAFARDVRVRIGPQGAVSPAVYGSQTWLYKAVLELIEHVIAVSSPGQDLELSLQTVGTRALLRARVSGTFGGTEGGSDSTADSSRTLPDDVAATHGIGLSLGQHIAELHGGTLRAESDFGVQSLVLDLPAGAPAREDARLAVEQAARFERSVVDLHAHSAARNALPRPRTHASKETP